MTQASEIVAELDRLYRASVERLQAALTTYLRAKLHPSVSVTLAPMQEIPRSKGGKYEDCMSLVT